MKKLNVKNGDKFGMLTVIGETDKRRGGCVLIECMCECGNKCLVSTSHLINGHKKSCGCLVKLKCREMGKSMIKHGMEGTRFYKIYMAAKIRCVVKSNQNYQSYGGRGIKMEWKSFKEFYNDMYESYLEHCERFGEKETTLDRIDNNGNYCKENCRWATHKEQARNTRRCRNVIYKGTVYKSLSELSEKLGLNADIISKRVMRGWDLITAIETPRRNYPLHI